MTIQLSNTVRASGVEGSSLTLGNSLNQTEHLEHLLQTFNDRGLHGATVLDSKGMARILHSEDEDIVAMSHAKKLIRPYLDDFAQLVGVSMRTTSFNTGDVMRSAKKVANRRLGKRGAVMIKDNGALCVAGDEYDAEAVEMVVKKNIKALVATGSFSHTKPINLFESALMNVVYKLKYSKNRDK